MCAAFGDDAVVEYDNLVTVAYGGKAVRDNNAGNTAIADGLNHFIFRFGVECGSGFIENENGRILRQHTGNFQALPLSAREIPSAAHQLMPVSAGKPHDVVVKLRVPRGEDHLKILNGIIPHLDVIGDSVLKHNDILIDDRQRTHHDFAGIGTAGFAVKEDFAAPRLIQPGEQLGNRGFAAAGRPDNGDPVAGLQGDGKIPDERLFQPGIAKSDVFQLDIAPQLFQTVGHASPLRGIFIIRIFHDVLDTLHLRAHFLNGLPGAHQRHGRIHKGA